MIKKVLLFTLTSKFGDKYRFSSSQNEKMEPFIYFDGDKYDTMVADYKRETQTRDSDMRAEISVHNAPFTDEKGIKTTLSRIAESEKWFYNWSLEVRDVDQRYLDALNFESGENEEADGLQGITQTWTIQKVKALTSMVMTFELGDPMGDLRLPKGTKIYSNICPYQYRGPHCGYTGPAVADKNNKPTTDILKDKCSNTMAGCAFRLLPDGSYRGLMFPAASSARDIL